VTPITRRGVDQRRSAEGRVVRDHDEHAIQHVLHAAANDRTDCTRLAVPQVASSETPRAGGVAAATARESPRWPRQGRRLQAATPMPLEIEPVSRAAPCGVTKRDLDPLRVEQEVAHRQT